MYLNDACLTSSSPANYQGKPINLLLSTNLPFSPWLLKRWLRLSVLSALRDTFFATLHHNHSVGDLPSLSLNPKALLEFYVSVGRLEWGAWLQGACACSPACLLCLACLACWVMITVLSLGWEAWSCMQLCHPPFPTIPGFMLWFFPLYGNKIFTLKHKQLFLNNWGRECSSVGRVLGAWILNSVPPEPDGLVHLHSESRGKKPRSSRSYSTT